MYRAALVIGLGGTGVLTLRHLKAQLLASQERRVPPQVKLIALDTVRDEKQADQKSGEVPIAAMRTDLDPGEYFWIGGDVYDFVREVDRGGHPHIGSWFQARTYLESLPRASFALERGAGQLRQFGRLAIFHDVAAPAKSSIKSLIDRAIQDIRRTGYQGSLDVFLVASVAGGTGAGMFVDMAYLVRQIAREEHSGLNVIVRGFLVLPEAFGGIPGGVKPSMRARAFACMRENKRFMVDFQYEHGYPMYYHASGEGGVWRNSIRTKLFDTLYHVDGQSQKNPLNHILPELGVPAAIADAIAAMLDKPKEGGEDVYARHTTNVMTEAGKSAEAVKTTSFDSAIGVYSLLLPMHHITSWLAHRLALQALAILLEPGRKDEDGYPVSLKPDANAEMPGVRGRDVAIRFLQAGEVQSLRSGERVAGTPFYQEVARIALAYRPNDATLAMELASRDAKAWEQHLDPPGETSEVAAIRQRVQKELSSRLTDEVPANQRGESAASAVERIQRGIETYKGFHLGREDMRTGQRQGGEYRKALAEYVRFQLERYRRMLEVECENILNGGQSADQPASVHRGGKLGYLIDFLEGIETYLGRFLTAMNEARDQREAQGQKAGAVTAAQGARQDLEANPGGLFGGRRRQAYVEAEQRLIDVEKTLIIEEVVRGLVDDMLQHTRGLREDAQAWANTLGLGYHSLYGRLLRGERQIRDAIAAEQKVPVREIVWDEAYLQQLYTRYVEETRPSGVDEYLAGLTWRHEQRRVGLRDEFGFGLSVKVFEDAEKNRFGRQSQDRNLELLLKPGEQRFRIVWEQESILKYLMMTRYPDPNELADRLAEKGDILLAAGGKTVVPANYLHVAHGTDPDERRYLDTVQRRLQDKTGAKGKLNEVVNSADRFALRLVHTTDLIPLDEVRSYKASEADYWSQSGEVEDGRGIRGKLGRETLHIFPAEVNAARLESRIAGSDLKIKPRALHNDVVLQMEDMPRFHLFVRCWAFGLIHRDQEVAPAGGYQNFWCLDLPEKDTGSVRGPEPPVRYYLTEPKPGEPGLVDAMTTWNYQRRDVRQEPYQRIDYARAQQALQETRNKTVAELRGQGLQFPAFLVARVEALRQKDKARAERFELLWAERQHLERRQQELRQQIFKAPAGGDNPNERQLVEADAAIALYLTLAQDIDSLNLAMDDILKSS